MQCDPFNGRGWVLGPRSAMWLSAWAELDKTIATEAWQHEEDPDRSLEALSLELFDLARGQAMEWVESLLGTRVVPLRIRLLTGRREPNEGEYGQDQAGYSAHFPKGAWAVSLILAEAATSLAVCRAAGLGHGKILPFRRVSHRVGGTELADLPDSAALDTECQTLRPARMPIRLRRSASPAGTEAAPSIRLPNIPLSPSLEPD